MNNYKRLRFSSLYFIATFVSLFLLIGISACSDSNPKIEGTIENADNVLITLEKSDYLGQWVVIDSMRTDAGGKYKFDIPRQNSPMVFRLGMDDKYIYFPIDSTETVTVNSRLPEFDTQFSLDGSDDARNMMNFEKELIALPHNADNATLVNFKRGVYTKYLQPSQGSVVAYYILTKTLDGKPLFDPADATDQRYYAAVATSFSQYAPNDPRTRLLEQTALQGLKARNAAAGKKNVVQATQAALIDITLPDENNQNVALSSVASNGKPTVLVFSLMNQPESPAFNARLLESLKKSGNRFNIYHVCFDSDLFAWREAAKNLPWTTVYDADGSNSKVLAQYNVRQLPAFYIINVRGELSDRADNFDRLDQLITKY